MKSSKIPSGIILVGESDLEIAMLHRVSETRAYAKRVAKFNELIGVAEALGYEPSMITTESVEMDNDDSSH